VKSYDKIIDAMGQIGDRLPQFRRYLEIFKSNANLKRVLLIFFEDILEFHLTALNFFKSKSASVKNFASFWLAVSLTHTHIEWELFFEAMWPKCGNKITIIMNNIERHAGLISSEVTLANILDSQEARAEAMAKYKRDEEFQQRQDLATVRQLLSPKLYDEELERFQKLRSPNSGKWIESDDTFNSWFSSGNTSERVLWVEGIPGAGSCFLGSCFCMICSSAAGKSFLSAYVVEAVQRRPNCNTVFAFLSFQDRQITTAKVIQSLIFQLVHENQSLHLLLSQEVQTNFRSVSSNTSYLQELFIKMLKMSEPTYVIVDGVDEIDVLERSFLLKALLETNRLCEDLKLLISSRSEHDISRILQNKARAIRTHEKNILDVEEFVQRKGQTWLNDSSFDDDTSSEIGRLLRPLASKSKGE
jgi:hypothetical protein